MRNSAVFLLLLAAAPVGCSDRAPGSATQATTGTPALRVELAPVERKDIARSITLPASIEAFEQARVYAKVSGYLRTLSVDIGDRVSRDQVLGELDVPEMDGEHATASAQLAEARAQLQKSDADLALQTARYERARALGERGAVTQADLEEAQGSYRSSRAAHDLARARIERAAAELARIEALMQYARIRAPFDGIVTERFVDAGTLIQAATGSTNVTPIVTVAHTDRVRAFVDVPEREVPEIGLEDTATLQSTALQGVTFEGHVARFARALYPKTRTMRVEVDFENLDGRLYPGMYGALTIALEQRAGAIVVPSTAVSRDPNGVAYVYVLADGLARRREVRTGFDDGINTEIVSGLDTGERCIVSASGQMRDGVPVEASGA